MNINNLIKSSIIVILTIIANIVTIIVFSIIFDTFQLGNWYNAVIITIGVIIANTIVWPVLRRLLMKFIVLTFGIGALIINSLIFYGVCCLIPGVTPASE